MNHYILDFQKIFPEKEILVSGSWHNGSTILLLITGVSVIRGFSPSPSCTINFAISDALFPFRRIKIIQTLSPWLEHGKRTAHQFCNDMLLLLSKQGARLGKKNVTLLAACTRLAAPTLPFPPWDCAGAMRLRDCWTENCSMVEIPHAPTCSKSNVLKFWLVGTYTYGLKQQCYGWDTGRKGRTLRWQYKPLVFYEFGHCLYTSEVNHTQQERKKYSEGGPQK